MLGSVGLEVMNSINPELNWKTVRKGRRSKKSVARSLKGVVKVGNSISPNKVGDFSGSESDKFSEMVPGQTTSGKSENVPLKKRRHLLQFPQPQTGASTLRCQDSASQITHSSSPLPEDHEQLQCPSSSGQRSSGWHLKGIEGSAKVRGGDVSDLLLCDQTEKEYNVAGDFSGIELLAAAASMDDDPDYADKKDLVENFLMLKKSHVYSSATLSKVNLKNESGDSSSKMEVHEGNMDCSQQNNSAAASKNLCGSPEDVAMPKVSRQHWDLNTLMDAWDEPFDDLAAADMEKDARDDMRMEGPKDSRDHVFSKSVGTGDESSHLKKDENESISVSEDRIRCEPPRLKENLQEPTKNIYSIAARETSNHSAGKDPNDRKSIQVLNCDADVKNLNEVTGSIAVLDTSPLTKLCCTSSKLRSELKTNSDSGNDAIMHDEGCSSNVSESDRSTVRDGNHTRTQDVNSLDIAASESVINIQLKGTEDFRGTFGLPGPLTEEAQLVIIADSNKQNDGAFVPGTKIADSQGHLEPAEFDAKHEDNNEFKEGLKMTLAEDTDKFCCSAGSQNDYPTTSIGRIGFLIDGWRVSGVSQSNGAHVANGDDLTGFQDGYDSPYEDGELRGSFLYSWEDNQMENECVDYESDGRNGDGSDAADCPGSEIVEGGSEVSNVTRRSVPLRASPEGKSKSGPVNHSLRKHSVRDESGNNEIGGKGSNAGSGTTVEQCMEMVMEVDGNMNRKQLIDQRDKVDVKVADIDEYASKMTARGKLQSRIEGRSSVDAADGEDVFFMRQCRPRRLGGSYSRPERDVSPDRYMGGYGRSTTHGERDGVHQWTSWDSRKRYSLNYQGAESRYRTRPRNKIDESVDKIDGADFQGPRPTSHYFLKGLHRPLVKRSPVERDDYFGFGRRIRGVGNYGNRGHYSQRGGCGRDFAEDFEALPDDAVRMPRYLPRRDRSFSPGAGRRTHMTLPRRRSRSRSRTRSPRLWYPHRERTFGTRRHSRSPEFRSEARMERMRLPFSKPSFTPEYGEDYMPPSRGHRFSSPQRNYRWVDDDGRNFADIRRRRSPVREFRRSQWPVRPGRFCFVGNGGRECKLDSNYYGRRRGDEVGEMMHRPLHSDATGNVRRSRHTAAGDDLGTNNLNDEEDNVGVAEVRDVGQGDSGEDTRTVKI